RSQVGKPGAYSFEPVTDELAQTTRDELAAVYAAAYAAYERLVEMGVAREWFRHRVGSFNEFSMRYARASDEFYVPDAEDVRTQVGKPGAYSFEPVSDELAEQTREKLQEVYDAAYQTYEQLVEAGVAREVARAALPVGAYTEFYWTVNARSLMNFISLRNSETAQREIRRYAEACERFLEEQMPVTYAAFVANDRTAP
ncbi:MAG TPA: FAD-dependent thymidylate synthase, partial [Gaiellaceae bacterium]|nr:FAD-dependent thymidylate synthase [Gaiellaceae bacterium]